MSDEQNTNRCNSCDAFVNVTEPWREATNDERSSHPYLRLNTTVRVAKAKCQCGKDGLAIEWSTVTSEDRTMQSTCQPRG